MKRAYPPVSCIRMKTKHFRDFINSFLLIERKNIEDFTNSSSSKQPTKGTKPRKDTSHHHLISLGTLPLLNRDLEQLV